MFHTLRGRGQKGVIMKKKVLSLFLAASMTAALLSGCGSSGSGSAASTAAPAAETEAAAAGTESAEAASTEAPAADAAAGGTVVIDRTLDSEILDPVMTANNCDIWVLNMMVEGLVTSSDDGQEIIPAVADKWDVSDDNLTYTFHIRDGIKFSDGNPVTAEDCVYSVQRAKDAEGPWLGMLDMVDTIEDGGDGTVVIKLKEASPSFLSALAMFDCGILEKSYCEEVGDDGLAEKPIGTGPFMLQEWTKGDRMVFVKNPYYWEEGKPLVDEVDFDVVTDDNTAIMQLESGQVDAVSAVPYARLAELEAADGITVTKFDSTDVRFILINCQGQYTSDKKVRQALALATDKAAINTAVFAGEAQLAETFLAPAIPYSYQDLPASTVDTDKAKELLADAGYPNGFSITVQVGSGDTAVLQIATLLQQQWAAIGVTLDIQQIDLATARQNWKDGNYDVFISNMTSDMTDISELAGLVTIADQAHCWRTYWNDEDQQKAEALTAAGNAEMDETKRADDYKQMQEIMADAVPLIPLCYVPFTFAASDKLSGYSQTPLGIYNFKNMSKAE